MGRLLKSHLFWLFLFLMVAAGASESTMAQWTSAFAEQGLGVSKTAGDMAGLLGFAVLMGTARAIYGKFGEKLDIEKFMGTKVYLTTWVKVKENWRDSDFLVRNFGYSE